MFGAQGLVSRNTQPNGLSPAGTLWYAFDERGSVAQRTGSSGGVASSDLYDAFGNVTSTGGPDVFGFRGQAGYYTDVETGLVLCTNRHYDPQSGRFLTRDPLGYGGGINLYSYTQNNPVNWMDPSGHGVMTTLAGPVGRAWTYGKAVVALGQATSGSVSAVADNGQTSVAAELREVVEAHGTEAAPGSAEEGINAQEVGEGFAKQGFDSGVVETSSAEILGAGGEGLGAAEGLGGVAAAGGAGGAAVAVLPVVVIAAGVYAVADLAHYAATGKSNGFFTSLGQKIADKLFPGPDGLPAPDQPRRKKCR